ncbi:MAG: hypothetical protein FJ184_15970 [Gammaproteobacteria bacterium]|nr:hypothetical protein [Gammaproteobacteria bacterium]
MSFILDALRKSENSRLRQDHPAVFSHRIVAERPRLPVWAVVLIALLAINLFIVAFLLLRTPSADTNVPIVPSLATSTPTPLEASIPELPQILPSTTAVTPVATDSVTPPHSDSLITRDDLLARGASLPPVDLNMHVYDANPSMRFVLLNGQRLREGESSKEGLSLERITPEGVVLRFGSNTFSVNLQ